MAAKPLDELLAELRGLLSGELPARDTYSFDWGVGDHFIGLSGLALSDTLELQQGVLLRPTYADVFASPMAAFAPPEPPRKWHPAPWVPVYGGWQFSIRSELVLLEGARLSGHDRERIAWFIPALIRLMAGVPARAVLVSNLPISDVRTNSTAARLNYFGGSESPLGDWQSHTAHLEPSGYDVARRHFETGGTLLHDDRFNRAFTALDQARFAGGISASATLLWTAVETVFAVGSLPGKGKLLSNCVADFLGSDEQSRRVIKEVVAAAYKERGHVVHAGHTTSSLSYQAVFIIAQWVFQTIVRVGGLPAEVSSSSSLAKNSDRDRHA